MTRFWYLIHAIASFVALWFAYRFAPANTCLNIDRPYGTMMKWVDGFLCFQIVGPLIAIGFRYRDWPWNVVLGIAASAWAVVMLIVAQLAGMCS